MMMTGSDLKSIGLAAGSRTLADAWKDWNNVDMLRESAKLLRNRTCWGVSNRAPVDNDAASLQDSIALCSGVRATYLPVGSSRRCVCLNAAQILEFD